MCSVAFTLPNVAIAILVNKLLDPQLWRTRLLFAVAFFQMLFAVIPCIVVYVQCRPIEKLWNTSMKGTCWSPAVLNDITYFLTGYTIFADVLLAVLPISAFWQLKMKRSTKVGLCVMMGLTLLSAIATIVKATYLRLFTDSTDPREYSLPVSF